MKSAARLFGLFLVVVVSFLAACGSGESASTAAHGEHAEDAECTPTGDPASATTHVDTALKDFVISTASVSVASGTIAFDAVNEGSHPHEIVIVRGVAPADLPKDADGSVDEAKLPDGALIGELEAFAAGKSCSGAFELAAGSYTLFCNVVGAEEGAHTGLGMVSTLTVT